jgi:hypothetical protein
MKSKKMREPRPSLPSSKKEILACQTLLPPVDVPAILSPLGAARPIFLGQVAARGETEYRMGLQ